MQAVAIGISFARRFPRPLHTKEVIYLFLPHVEVLSKPQEYRVVLLLPQPLDKWD